MIAVYYFGRFCQVVGMWLLLVDIFTAGPLGPDPRLFAAGVVTFVAGWALTRFGRHPKQRRGLKGDERIEGRPEGS
jgi:hypothetical protein